MPQTAKVWTKQHRGILEVLERCGRYIVKREYIEEKMEEHADLYTEVYAWYAHRAAEVVPKPDDVLYPIWVSLDEAEVIGGGGDAVLLELDVPREELIVLDIDKWGLIVNYMYIPRDEADREDHEKMLASYRLDDTEAYMSPFYPSVKSKIRKSWDRLFDDSVVMSPVKVGTLWEVKREWIVKITE